MSQLAIENVAIKCLISKVKPILLYIMSQLALENVAIKC